MTAEPSSRPFMGATPFSDEHGSGVTFRVWAPNAKEVTVTGSFDQWQSERKLHCLASEGNGYWSADISQAHATDEYKFLLWNGDADNPLFKVDPYAREVMHSNGPGIVAPSTPITEPSHYRTPTREELVIYELHIGTFTSDPRRYDGRGTFDSAIEKLDYLQDLGVNAVQVMPANEFATDIGLGYNSAYLFAIETSYGGPDAVRRFVRAAHERGIAVIFDIVLNHLGPSDIENSVWRFDGWHQGDYGGIYFYNDDRAWTPWGEKNRPDYGREEVRRFLRDAAMRWLEQRHCDGLRWDATNYIRNVHGGGGHDIPDGWALMQWINNEIQWRQPWKFSIAEDMQDNEWLTKPTSARGAGFTSQWSAGFVHRVRAAIQPADDQARDMSAVCQALEQRYNGDAFQRVVFTESHDEVGNGKRRVVEDIWPGNADSYWSRKRSSLGAALAFTVPGIPMLFQGQEFGEDRWFDDHWALSWDKLNRPHLAGLHAMYRDLIRLRRNWHNQTRGLKGQHLHLHHVNHSDKVIAFHRWDRGGRGDDVIVLANMSNRCFPAYDVGVPRNGLWRVRFNSDARCYGHDFTNTPGFDFWAVDQSMHGMPCRGTVGIGPYSVLIMSQD